MPTQKGPARWAGPFSYASLAQSVEHAAVNRRVVGSSPTWGARLSPDANCVWTLFILEKKTEELDCVHMY